MQARRQFRRSQLRPSPLAASAPLVKVLPRRDIKQHGFECWPLHFTEDIIVERDKHVTWATALILIITVICVSNVIVAYLSN